jgi:hypothetical protein
MFPGISKRFVRLVALREWPWCSDALFMRNMVVVLTKCRFSRYSDCQIYVDSSSCELRCTLTSKFPESMIF